MSRDGIHTDESHWPIVVHTTVGVPSDADVDRFIARAQAILERRRPHVVVFDSTRSGRASSHMRSRSMAWLKANSEDLTRYCLGTALVFHSPALRFVMSTVMLVASHQTPHIVCGTLEEALRWSRTRVDEHARLSL